MQTEYLIVGQGIAGTLLSGELLRRGKEVLVIDDTNAAYTSSKMAGALINPVAGRKWDCSESQEQFYHYALSYYSRLEQDIESDVLTKLPLYIFHPNGEEHTLFALQERDNVYLSETEHNFWIEYFQGKYGVGTIQPVGLINNRKLLHTWQTILRDKGLLIDAVFDINALNIVANGIDYKDIKADKVIFCEGASGVSNPFFSSLPFTENAGDVLILHIPGLPSDAVYHYKDVRLIPLGENRFWCGSNYRWNVSSLVPDKQWASATRLTLEEWLKIPFEISDHLVARRPTTAGQFPLIGMHPRYNGIGIFNGLGTRGFSSAPFWVASFADYLSGINRSVKGYDQERFNRYF